MLSLLVGLFLAVQHCVTLSLLIGFSLRFTLSEIKIAISCCFQGPAAWNTVFKPLIFNLWISFKLGEFLEYNRPLDSGFDLVCQSVSFKWEIEAINVERCYWGVVYSLSLHYFSVGDSFSSQFVVCQLTLPSVFFHLGF